MDASEAVRSDLVNRVVARSQLIAEYEKVVKKISLLTRTGVKLTKDTVRRAMEEMH